MILTECGATRSDSSRHPRQVHRHHVGVSLDHDDLMTLGDVLLGVIEPEQHLRLLVQHGLRRVHVLAEVVVVEQLARTETDDVSTEIADRPQQTAMESVDGALAALLRQAGCLQFGELEALRQQRLGHRVPACGGVTAAEGRRRSGVEVPFGEVVARNLRVGGSQLLGVVLLRGGVGSYQAGAGSAITCDRRPATLVVDLISDPVGELLDGLDKADVLLLLQEAVDVATLAASEAVEMTVMGTDVKRRRLLVVKGTQSLESVGTCRTQCDVVADDLLDACLFTDCRDVTIGNSACHVPSVVTSAVRLVRYIHKRADRPRTRTASDDGSATVESGGPSRRTEEYLWLHRRCPPQSRPDSPAARTSGRPSPRATCRRSQ